MEYVFVEMFFVLFGYFVNWFGWVLVCFVGMVGGNCVIYVINCIYFGEECNFVVFKMIGIIVVIDFFVMMVVDIEYDIVNCIVFD